MRELKNVKASMALLDGHAKEMAHCCEVAAGELELIKSSIETLVERQKSRTKRKKPNHYHERWGCSSYARSPNCYKLLGFGNGSVEFTEFSALDLQTATCDFSESFKLGLGGYECVYKGEILNRTVMIKKLHLYNVQGQEEFQQEMLTGKSPLGLTSEVRRAVLCDSLSLILDTSAGEWPTDLPAKLADFGLRCSEMNCRDRPELTPEVVWELEQLHLMEEQPIPPFFLCPILQEIMHDPHVAADGFTYEVSALRGWLEQGRWTSPITNLELDHLDLTPNHALRFAIQGWLCQPWQFE